MTLTQPSIPAPLTADDFRLDVEIVDDGPIIPELLRSTSDNCGATCASACTSCNKA
jgi:FxLD family lantipeptide